MKDFELNIGQGRLLQIREYGVAGVAELRILGREDFGSREALFDTPLKEEYAMLAALALVEAASLLPDFTPEGSITTDWMENYRAKEWDKAMPATILLKSMAWYREQLDDDEEQERIHNEKILSDARAFYNKQRSACDLIWEDLSQKGQVRWIEIALLAEKLNAND